MANWERYVWVNPSRISPSSSELHGSEFMLPGVSINVQLSPYDMPKGVSGSYDGTHGTFTIRYDYINKEKERITKKIIEGATIIEGDVSGKLLGIILPIDKPPLQEACIIELRNKFLSALTTREGQLPHHKADAVLNNRIARMVIKEEMNELVPSGHRGLSS